MNDTNFENTFCFESDNYKNSLDVLLELIKKKKTNIRELDIKELTSQFINYVETHKNEVSLEQYSDYAKMSAYLIELKTRSLLPNMDLNIKNSNSFEEERELFIKRLLEYQMYKNAIPLLMKYKEKRNYLIDKLPEDYDEYISTNLPITKLPKRLNIDKLKNAFENVLVRSLIKERLEEPTDLHMSTQEYTVDEVILELIESLHKKNKNGCTFSYFFANISEKKQNIDYFCMLFFVILSLVHQGYLFLEEKENDFFIDLNNNLLLNEKETINFIETIKKDLFGDE